MNKALGSSWPSSAPMDLSGPGLDPHNPPPSRVVHVRGVPDGCRETDLINASCAFGTVSYVLLMPRQRQALIEMSTLESAVSLVQYSQNNPILVLGHRVYMNFSKSKEIIRDHARAAAVPLGEGDISMYVHALASPAPEPGATKTLLITVQNPLYPITTDVIHTITAPHGQVLRIVISRKGALQAFVEYDSLQAAMRAKHELQGADVYAGCCTLRIEYSRTGRLNVRRNDQDTWDYTWAGPMAVPGPLLPQPPGQYGGPMGGYDRGGDQHAPYGHIMAMDRGPGPGYGMDMCMGMSPVLLLYGVNECFNCNHLFNILCLYGNVLKVKFLLNKQGMAMVHMGDPGAADLAMKNLDKATVMGCKLDISSSKHNYIAGMTSAPLPDGTPSCVDFTQSPLNRFNKAVIKNRVYTPSTTLHFFNGPPDLTTEQIQELLVECKAPAPTGLRVFDKGDPTRNATGLIEWPNHEASLTALALTNHYTIKTASGGQYTFKLAFSSNDKSQRM